MSEQENKYDIIDELLLEHNNEVMKNSEQDNGKISAVYQENKKR